MKKRPILSLIIPCFNAQKYIKNCLGSILDSKFADYEIIIVDDGSTDSSVKLFCSLSHSELVSESKNRKILKQVQDDSVILTLILNKENLGPVKARNLGSAQASGKYLFFLDADTKIGKGCLKAIVEKFKQDPKIGAIQTKLIQPKLFSLRANSAESAERVEKFKTYSSRQARTRTLETSGHFLSFFGFPYEINLNKESLIFGARSAAMAIRKDLFNQINGLDKDYFIYGEDTDLSWRVWLAGYQIKYLPQAKVYHFQKSSLNKKTEYRIFYQGAKNNLSNILKNAPLKVLIWMLPLHLLAWFLLSLKLIIQRRPTMALWIYKGLAWNLRNLDKVLKKRKKVATYTIKNNQALEIMFGSLSLKKLIIKGWSWFKNV